MSDLVKLVGELTAVRGQRDALMVEIERLREEITDAREARDDWAARWRDAQAEIERLRALLREWLEGSEEGADTYEQRVREAMGDA